MELNPSQPTNCEHLKLCSMTVYYVVLNEVFTLHWYAIQFALCIIIIIIILMQSCDAQNRLAQHSVGHGHIDTPSQVYNSKFKLKKKLIM